MTTLLFLVTLFLAYANGANDNFKGVATLFGSRTLSYRASLALATIMTAAGAVCSVMLAKGLLAAFSGRGLVPDGVTASPTFLLSVASGAGLTVMLATLRGLPISTTHALTGALVGAGFVVAGEQLNIARLGTTFLLPLLLSPVAAVLLTVVVYRVVSRVPASLGISRAQCVCVGPGQFVALSAAPAGAGARTTTLNGPGNIGLSVTTGSETECAWRYQGHFLGISVQRIVDALHCFSAAAVCFARSLNDAPKIAALLAASQLLQVQSSVLVIAAGMVVGGLLHARRVAETMAVRIATISDSQGLTANMVTACLVIFASRLGLPVSTTHVSVGAISGIGLVNGTVDRRILSGIVVSWVLTLPLAALVAGLIAELSA